MESRDDRKRTRALSRRSWLTKCEKETPREGSGPRSEEHTSELQSHLNLVCRLLLEKKKKKAKDKRKINKECSRSLTYMKQRNQTEFRIKGVLVNNITEKRCRCATHEVVCRHLKIT